MDLHYSQTYGITGLVLLCFTTLWIYTILKHKGKYVMHCKGFTTLWIYTILKRVVYNLRLFAVSLPYGFTLFSNILRGGGIYQIVSLPYGFTIFSNK